MGDTIQSKKDEEARVEVLTSSSESYLALSRSYRQSQIQGQSKYYNDLRTKAIQVAIETRWLVKIVIHKDNCHRLQRDTSTNMSTSSALRTNEGSSCSDPIQILQTPDVTANELREIIRNQFSILLKEQVLSNFYTDTPVFLHGELSLLNSFKCNENGAWIYP